MKIKNICVEIINILEKAEEHQWLTNFIWIVNNLNTWDKDTLKKNILSLYGGMDSFNDLVLFKNGRLSVLDNNSLDKLRTELYIAVSEI